MEILGFKNLNGDFYSYQVLCFYFTFKDGDFHFFKLLLSLIKMNLFVKINIDQVSKEDIFHQVNKYRYMLMFLNF